jgi:hypothetical protein
MVLSGTGPARGLMVELLQSVMQMLSQYGKNVLGHAISGVHAIGE